MPPRKKKQVTLKQLTYICDISYPELEIGTIHRFKKYRAEDKHYYIKCCETCFSNDGTLCECNMEPTREDHFKRSIANGGQHICSPGKPVDQLTLDSFTASVDDIEPKVITEDILYTQIAIFTGKKNLSLNVLTSEEFYNLAIMFISYGASLNSCPKPTEVALKSFAPIKRDKLKYIMTTTAFKKHGRTLALFSQISYVSIAMDEGKTSKNQNLHFVIEAPFSKLKSYPYHIVRMKGGKTRDYIEAIPRGLYPLQATNISVGSVVIDGNTAQKKAWNPNYKKSVYHFNNIPDIHKVLVIPCLCHRIHNSYKSQVKKNKKLKEICDKLHKIAEKCQDNSNKLGSICPSHVDTRWAYDFDIVDYILKHKKTIREFYDLPIKDLENLRDVLIVFKVLVATFENPKTLMQTAFKLLERTINFLEELHTKEANPYGLCLSQSLKQYTLDSNEGGLWTLAYCLTPEGREDMRRRNILQMNPKENNYRKFFHLDELPNDNIEKSVTNLASDEAVFMTENGKPVSTAYSDSDDDSSSISEEEEEEEEDKSEEPQYSRPYKNYLIGAKNMLKNFLTLRKLPKNEVDNAIHAFNSYMDDDDEPFIDYINTSNNYSWIQIRMSIESFADIADIAMRLLSAATSEASCERAISRQRLIHSNRRLRSSEQLLDARMILSYA